MTIKTRKVFYIAGFDPRGARHYYNVFKKELKNAPKIKLGERKKISNIETTWHIQNGQTKTNYSFLHWDDIVRQHWSKNTIETIGKSTLAYINTLAKTNQKIGLSYTKWPIVTLSLPFITLLITAIILIGLCKINIFLAIAAGGLALWLFKKFEFLWLMRLFIFNDILAKNEAEPLLSRAEKFADNIAKNHKKYDEILVIGHSNGAHFLPVLISLLKKKSFPQNIKFISMGHCLPILSLREDCPTYREHLINAASAKTTWLDIGSPADGTCYPFTSPYEKIIPEDDIKNMVILKSPRFHKLYDAEEYARLKRDKFEYHFLYIKWPQNDVGFNYFDMTTGKNDLKSYIEKTWGKP